MVVGDTYKDQIYKGKGCSLGKIDSFIAKRGLKTNRVTSISIYMYIPEIELLIYLPSPPLIFKIKNGNFN